MVGGLGEKTKSLALNRAYSVTRQTGSTIKPIGAYALGIEYGLVNWSTMLNNSPLYLKQDMVIRDEDYCRKNGLMGLSGQAAESLPNAWRSWPRNYGGNYGDNSDMPLWNGLARSLNTIAVRVGDLVGASNIFNFVYNTLQLNTLDPANDVGLAQMVMGSQTHGVTPTALAAAFQIFYDGEYTTPHLYTRVLDRDGNIYLENNATSYQALTPRHRLCDEPPAEERSVLQRGPPAAATPTPTAWKPLARPVPPATKRICGSWAARPTTSPPCGGATMRPMI